MAESTGRTAVRSLLIGIVSGMRSMMGPAIAIDDLARHKSDTPLLKLFSSVASPSGTKLSAISSIGEVICDKLPFIGARTQIPSVIFRCLSGAFAGGALASSRKSSSATGAVFGILGALIGTYGGYHARKWIDEKTKLPDSVTALIEDGVAVGIGRAATYG